jgi:hypothetical protein
MVTGKLGTLTRLNAGRLNNRGSFPREDDSLRYSLRIESRACPFRVYEAVEVRR